MQGESGGATIREFLTPIRVLATAMKAGDFCADAARKVTTAAVVIAAVV